MEMNKKHRPEELFHEPAIAEPGTDNYDWVMDMPEEIRKMTQEKLNKECPKQNPDVLSDLAKAGKIYTYSLQRIIFYLDSRSVIVAMRIPTVADMDKKI